MMQEEQGRSNAQSLLFGLVTIPSDNQIRNLLDTIPASLFHPVFRFCVEGLCPTGILDSFRMQEGGSLMGNLLIAIDGTGYYSSQKLHCEHCTIKIREKGTDREKIYYEHSVSLIIRSLMQTLRRLWLQGEPGGILRTGTITR